MPTATQKRPSIRQAQTDMTKSAILESAQYLFSTQGYTETGVRDIAARANVNPALIGRHFGSKLELFEAALESYVDVAFLTDFDKANFGEQVAAAFCRSKSGEALVVPALVISTGDSAAREIALKILKKRAEKPLKDWLGGPQAADKSAQLIAVITGFFTHRMMLPLSPMSDEPNAGMQAWLARTLQEIVDR